jgi:hypothetical protein
MIKTRITRWLAAIVTGGALALVPMLASSAGASTTGCAAGGGAFAGYCGTQVNNNSVAMNVKGNGAKWGTPIVGYTSHVATPGSDFTWIEQGNGSGLKEAIYTPNGTFPTQSGQLLCLSQPSTTVGTGYALRFCNLSGYQGFSYSGGQWVNEASGQAISQSTTASNALVSVTAGSPTAESTWTFTTAVG